MTGIGAETQLHIGTKTGWHPTWYVADLPGHNGTKRIRTGPEVNSDWGWTADRGQAIQLTPYWQRRFLADRRRVGREARIES